MRFWEKRIIQWPEEKKRRLKTMSDDPNLSWEVIADRLGLSYQTTIKYAKQFGFFKTKYVGRKPAPTGFWTDEKTNRLKELCKNPDLSFADIGGELGCTRSAAAGQANRLGIRKVTSHATMRRGPGARKPQNSPRFGKGRFARSTTPQNIQEPVEETRTPQKRKKRERERLPPGFSLEEYNKRLEEQFKKYKVPNIPNHNECKFIKGSVRNGTAFYCGMPIAKEGIHWCDTHDEKVHVRGSALRARRHS